MADRPLCVLYRRQRQSEMYLNSVPSLLVRCSSSNHNERQLRQALNAEFEQSGCEHDTLVGRYRQLTCDLAAAHMQLIDTYVELTTKFTSLILHAELLKESTSD